MGLADARWEKSTSAAKEAPGRWRETGTQVKMLPTGAGMVMTRSAWPVLVIVTVR